MRFSCSISRMYEISMEGYDIITEKVRRRNVFQGEAFRLKPIAKWFRTYFNREQ